MVVKNIKLNKINIILCTKLGETHESIFQVLTTRAKIHGVTSDTESGSASAFPHR